MKQINEVLKNLGIKSSNKGATTGNKWYSSTSAPISSYSPIDGSLIATVEPADKDIYQTVIAKAQSAYKEWRMVPAPQRGEIVRQIGDALRENKEDLGALVTIEMGKIYQEGLGEVQEMIDICDFAVGQSRLLNGSTLHSERPEHRMYDQYHSLGIVGIITAFNFPVAVWAWNAMLAAVCGDVVVWKPSSKVPLTAIAIQNIITKVLIDNNLPEGIFNLIIARSSDLGDDFVNDPRVPLFSVTGSTNVGREIGKKVHGRFGKTILELGGNNAVIVSNNADIDMALTSIIFGSVGTAAQRCTSTRRIIVQEDVYDEVKQKLIDAYKVVSTKIGNPLNEKTLIGPLIDKRAVEDYKSAIVRAKAEGGNILCGNKVLDGKEFSCGTYVVPTIIEVENSYDVVKHETFAPVLYMIKYKTLAEAIFMQNDVPQGLSSAIFTLNMREAEQFLSEAGSDCGIANVNIGTSGAEIGGAFGGEKETGGGRESGSDAWKAYMRRQTNTINYGATLPLAQGITFDFLK